MKVLWAVSGGLPLFGGAQVTAHSFLRRLREERGWQVLLTTRHHRRARLEVRSVPIETYRDVEELAALARRQRPRVLVCALDAVADGLRVAARFGIPSIIYLHSFEQCPPTADEVEAWGVSAERTYAGDDASRDALRAANRLIANSRFLGERVRQHHGVEAEVIHPEIEPVEIGGGSRPGRYVAAVCGHLYKGARIFLALADAFPHERFLLAGDVDPALAEAFAARANVRCLGRVPRQRLLALSRVVLVPSQWPEPFGRIAVEAMAAGLPVLASRSGGLAEIAGDSALGIDAWRDAEAWADALGALLRSPEALRAQAALGLRLAAPFVRGDSSRALAAVVEDVCRAAAPDFDTRVLALAGDTARATAYSMINAAWQRALAGRDGLRIVDSAAPAASLADVVVQHDYGESFTQASAPDAGRLVVVRTWDFGPYPPAWVDRINAEADLLLVYSEHVRRHALASGIPAPRVRVVPPGVDHAIFTPEGPKLELATRKSFRFLFVGAPVPRKGADILLAAYRRAFGPEDDVCLVIKDHPHDLFYEGAALRDRVLAATRDGGGPEVEYICELLPAERLAALYRACDAGVFPYRAEGFCLPILEAMAAGLPSIVPRFGAALDYCSARTSLLMDVRRIRLPVGLSMEINTLGFREQVEEVEFCETPVDVLAEHMRRAAATPPARLARLARAGVRVARRRFSWEASATRLLAAIDARGGGVPRRLRDERARRAHDARRLEIARQLLSATPPRS